MHLAFIAAGNADRCAVNFGLRRSLYDDREQNQQTQPKREKYL